MMSASVGQKAPEFEAPVYYQAKFQTTKLSDFNGKWVMLYFHPGDFTFVCGTELSDLACRYPELQQLGVEVISFSVDNLYVHKVWNDNEISKIVDGGILFRMGSDAGGKIGSQYGVYDESRGQDLRGRFIIDPDGILQTIEILSAPVGRSMDEALRQIQAFQHVRDTKGAEACPASWQPGQAGIKISTDLVGNLWKVWKPKSRETK
jgi:alkyl hydroperoxide reductase subunit AhpC